MKLTKEQLAHYMEKGKEFEARSASTNERNAYWKQYFTPKKATAPGRSETSFDMGKF